MSMSHYHSARLQIGQTLTEMASREYERQHRIVSADRLKHAKFDGDFMAMQAECAAANPALADGESDDDFGGMLAGLFDDDGDSDAGGHAFDDGVEGSSGGDEEEAIMTLSTMASGTDCDTINNIQ